jgi:hypothetical protein
MPWALAPPDLRPKLDDLGPPDDNTDLNATRLRHGLMPKLSGDPGQFLSGDGSFGTPGAVALNADAIVTLYDDLDPTKLAQFQLSGLSAATTRTYTLQDASMTLAGTNFANDFTKAQTIQPDSAAVALKLTRSTASANVFEAWVGANERVRIGPAGRLCVFTTSATGYFNVESISVATPAINSVFSLSSVGSGNSTGLWRLTPTLTGDPDDGISDTTFFRVSGATTYLSGTLRGIEASLTLNDPATSVTPTVSALNFTVTTAHASPEAYNLVTGAIGSVSHTGTGAVTTLEGLGAAFTLSGTGVVTNVRAVWPSVGVSAGATATNVAGFYYESTAGGTLTNNRAIHLVTIAGTNPWSVYSEPDAPMYHRGKIGVGSGMTAPTASFHAAAGSASASSAPLKFTSGTSMTSAEVGAFEFTTDDLFFTITTSTARKRLLMADATGGLTSGRVPFVTTNGRLLDDATFLFAVGTLTLSATNIATDTTTGMKVGTGTTQKLGFFNSAPIVQPTALTAQLTTITFTSPGTPDYAIADLTNVAPYGFVSQDEGRTVLSVISNLQVRVQEIENRFSAAASGLGLIA